MERLTVQGRWKISFGIALQLASIAFIAYCGSRMQMRWGVAGLVASEIMLLVIALMTSLVHRTPLREVFPVRKITLAEAFGLFLFSIGGFLLNAVVLGLTIRLISSVTGETSYVSTYISGQPPVVLLISSAFLPAICEEALERGAVLGHFRSVRREWVTILVMGLFFGLFHMSPGRFLSSACLGALLTYLMVKKNNILFPVILHFINNMLTIMLPLIFGPDSYEIDLADYTYVYLLAGVLIPLFLITGNALMCPGALCRRHLVPAVALSAVLLVGGLAGVAAVKGRVVNDKVYVLQETLRKEYPLEIGQEGLYFVKISSSYRGSCGLWQDGVREIAGENVGKSDPCVIGVYRLSEGSYTITYEVLGGADEEVDLDATVIRINI